MTVNSSSSKTGPYNGDGVQVDFPFNFKCLSTAHVAVYLNDAQLSSGYSVALSESGGTVSFSTPPAANSTVMLLRNIPFDQQTDLQNNQAFYPEVLEASFDKLTMLCQQLAESLTRCVKASPSYSGDIDVDDLSAKLTAAIAAGVSAAIDAATASTAATTAVAARNEAVPAATRAMAAETITVQAEASALNSANSASTDAGRASVAADSAAGSLAALSALISGASLNSVSLNLGERISDDNTTLNYGRRV